MSTADLNDIYLRLGSMQADQMTMKKDVEEIKVSVRDMNNFRIKVVAYCTAASGFITFIFSIFEKGFLK